MLAYFPQAYPGELLYSLFVRYHRHTGMPGPSHTMKALFGHRMRISSLDLPGYLQTLVEQLPPDYCLSADHIINTLTLFPYFTAFAAPPLRAQVRKAMRVGSTENLHMRLGISAFRIGRTQQLRFCAQCSTEMLAKFGERWWCRDHQLPGVLVCPTHGCLLLNSTVSIPQSSRHEFIAATAQNCPTNACPTISLIDHSCLAHLSRLAQRSADLLHNPPPARTLSAWTSFYRSQTLEAGLAKSHATMDQSRLAHSFREFYGKVLSLLPAVMQGDDFAGDWLAAMVRKHRKANHPLYHVLLQDFLAHRENYDSPFGRAPWPCLNPLAEHYQQLVVHDFARHRNAGNTVGVFSCSCGYTYTRCLVSQTQKLGQPRFQQFGPTLEPALRQFARSGMGLRAIGRQLQLDPKTILRLANELRVAIPWTCKQNFQSPATSKKHTKIPCFQSPIASEKKSSARKKTARPSRKDWAAIDQAWAGKLKAWIVEIRKEIPPVKITIAELERRANVRGWILKRRQHLPQTMALLTQQLESIAAFQRRRIHWAISELARDGSQVRAWQVMRKAGLRSSKLEEIRAILDGQSIPSSQSA